MNTQQTTAPGSRRIGASISSIEYALGLLGDVNGHTDENVAKAAIRIRRELGALRRVAELPVVEDEATRELREERNRLSLWAQEFDNLGERFRGALYQWRHYLMFGEDELHPREGLERELLNGVDMADALHDELQARPPRRPQADDDAGIYAGPAPTL